MTAAFLYELLRPPPAPPAPPTPTTVGLNMCFVSQSHCRVGVIDAVCGVRMLLDGGQLSEGGGGVRGRGGLFMELTGMFILIQ